MLKALNIWECLLCSSSISFMQRYSCNHTTAVISAQPIVFRVWLSLFILISFSWWLIIHYYRGLIEGKYYFSNDPSLIAFYIIIMGKSIETYHPSKWGKGNTLKREILLTYVSLFNMLLIYLKMFATLNLGFFITKILLSLKQNLKSPLLRAEPRW